MVKNRLDTKKMVTVALLIALHVVLGLVSLTFGNMKVTFDGLPIIISAICFGPVWGTLTGLLGAFLAQLLTYGITATTVLWILPAAMRGLVVGLFFLRTDPADYKQWHWKSPRLLLAIILSSLLVTGVNTLVMYLDSIIYHYYSYAYVFGATLIRFISSLLTAIAYCVVVPLVMKPLMKFLKK